MLAFGWALVGTEVAEASVSANDVGGAPPPLTPGIDSSQIAQSETGADCIPKDAGDGTQSQAVQGGVQYYNQGQQGAHQMVMMPYGMGGHSLVRQ